MCHACGAIVIIDEHGNPLADRGAPRTPEPVAQIERVTIGAQARDTTSARPVSKAPPKSAESAAPVRAPARVESVPLDPLDYLSGLDQPRSNAAVEETKPIEATPAATFADSTYAGENSQGFEPAATRPDHFGDFDSHVENTNLQVGRPNDSSMEALEALEASLDQALNENSLDSAAFPVNSDFADMGGYENSEPQQSNYQAPVQVSNDPNAFQMPDLYDSPSENPGSMLSEEDPLGLNAFANSEVSAANDGMLMCRILIDGIDTKEIRATLRAAMDDQRFNWDQNEILSHLKSGHLVIENITPIKAMVLIKRIKQIPVHIRWEQYTIAEVEEAPVSNAPEFGTN